MRRSVTTASNALAAEPVQRLAARADRDGVVAAIAEPVGERPRHLEVVVDDQDRAGAL